MSRIVLVIHALTAGKDLKSLKDHVRFVIETRKTQLANCAQGLPGRVCGYHSNRDIKIYANERILEYFSQFELSPEIMFDNEWMSGLRMDEKVGTLTTHTKLNLLHKSGYFTDIDNTFKLDYDEILSDKGKELLGFLSNDQYETLIRLFSPSVYEDNEFVSFCSEIKGFESLKATEFDYNHLGLNYKSVYDFNGTKFKNIYQTKPGSILEINLETLEKREIKWFNPLENLFSINPNYNKTKEDFYNKVFNATKLRLDADLKIGTSLSGSIPGTESPYVQRRFSAVHSPLRAEPFTVVIESILMEAL